VISVLVPLSDRDRERFARGQRRRFTLPDPNLKTAVICETCRLSFEEMTVEERRVCRG
jgi:hypothetical protein